MSATSVHIDQHIGVTGSKIYWMRSKYGQMYWCRMVIGIMGSYNMTEEERATISPFDPKFYDNYIEGKGVTKEEALMKMNEEVGHISESLWIV